MESADIYCASTCQQCQQTIAHYPALPWRYLSQFVAMLSLLVFSAALAAPPAALPYRRDMVRSALAVFGPSAPVATLAAQIHQESAWKPDAKSWAGAQGLAQFMPATAADMAKQYPRECAPANPFSARWSFNCRDRYMAYQLRSAGKLADGECSSWAFAFRGYNGGAGWAARDRKAAATAGVDSSNWLAVEPFNAGRSAAAIRENRDYPRRIFTLERRYTSWGRALECKQ